MRSRLSQLLVTVAKADERMLLLTGDHGYALFDPFRQHCPERFINAGIAEQNMVGVAAGLAKGGFRPFVYGLSAFVPIRVLEQIKLDVCYEKLPVIFLGDGAGVVYSTLGTSHQSIEDVAALRAVPNITILSPCDRWELEACFEQALATDGPVYIRLGKADLGDVHEGPVALRLGRLLQVGQASPGGCALIATGSMVQTALAAARRLGYERFSIYSAPTLKPLDEAQVTAIAEQHQQIATLEEHNVIGGLGSAIAEITSQNSPIHVHRLGVRDRFSKHAGSYRYLMREHGLDEDSVVAELDTLMARKNAVLD